MASGERTLTVKVVGDTSGLGRSFTKASRQSQDFGSSMHHHVVGGLKAVGAAASVAGGLIGVSFAGALADGIKLAADNQVAMTKLKKSVENSGLSWKRYGKELEDTADKMAGLTGFTNTDLESSLATLITTTGKVTSAHKLQGEAMDLARAKGMSLQQTSVILSKVWNGNTTSLTRLGIYLTKSTKNYDAYMASTKHATAAGKAHAKELDLIANRQAALTQLQQKFGGSTKAYADTASGALARIRASAEVLLERLGQQFLPYLNRFAAWFAQNLPTIQRDATRVFSDLQTGIKEVIKVGGPFLSWLNKNRDVVLAAAAAMGVLVAGIELYAAGKWLKAAIVGTENMTAAQTALNLVLDANPFALAVIGAAALAAGLVILWKRSGTFRTIVKGVLHDVQIAFGAVTGFVRSHWGSAMGFVESAARHIWTVIGPIIGFIHQHWQTLLGFMTGGISTSVIFIVNHWGTIKHAADAVIGFVVHRWGNIKSAISTFAGWVNKYVIGPIKTIISWAKQAVGWIEKLNPFSGSGSASTGPGNRRIAAGQAQANVRIASGMLGRYGWGQDQMRYLLPLWNQESGWSAYAVNSSSNAQGIPQLLPSQHPGPHPGFPSWPPVNPTAQIAWGLSYIKGRKDYGSPARAWAHEQAYGWYDQGGIVPGPRGVHRPVMVAGGETILPTHKSGGMYGIHIHNHFHGPVIGEREIDRTIRASIIRTLKEQGPNAFKTATGLRP